MRCQAGPPIRFMRGIKFEKQFSLDSVECRLERHPRTKKRIIFEDRGSRHMKSRSTTAGLFVICLGFCGNAWCQQEPAAEGRPITPAGALLIDQTTHLPAVGALSNAMHSSPHASGSGGNGPAFPLGSNGCWLPLSQG